MKRFLLVMLALLMLGAGVASARPADCVVALAETERDAAVAALEMLLGAALMTGDYMIDLATIQEVQRVLMALEAAPTLGCALITER